MRPPTDPLGFVDVRASLPNEKRAVTRHPLV